MFLHPTSMYVCSICGSASILIVFLMSSNDVHTGMSVAMLFVCMLTLIQVISWVFVSSMIVAG